MMKGVLIFIIGVVFAIITGMIWFQNPNILTNNNLNLMIITMFIGYILIVVGIVVTAYESILGNPCK